MSKRRPYIYEDRSWPEIAGIQEKVDVQGDEVPLSEFDRPYIWNNPDDDFYGNYEWDYPPIGPFPELPPPDPVPVPGPCNNETGCDFLTIVSPPEEVECDSTYTFRTIHVVSGCEPASYEDAFIAWSITKGEIISQSAGSMTWKAPSCCHGDSVTVCARSVDGQCEDCRSFKLKCEFCCEEFEIVGPDTVDAGTTWGGNIDPPCPGAECTVSNNSGCPMTCEVNTDGTSVTVPVGIKNCGSFTVTVTRTDYESEDEPCEDLTASKTVRINDNSRWILCGGSSFFLCNGPFCSCDYISGEQRWRIWIGAGIFCGPCLTTACWDNWANRPPVGNVIWGPRQFCANECDTNGPCAGSSLWGVSTWYWGNPDCECF